LNGVSDKYDAIQMDPLIMSAARAPAAGDPIAALNLVALRDDAPALALRGIAMARLATSFERKLFCEVPRAPSARKRLSLELARCCLQRSETVGERNERLCVFFVHCLCHVLLGRGQ